MKQTNFDKACDVFYSRLDEEGITYTKFEADSSITPALEEFKDEYIKLMAKTTKKQAEAQTKHNYHKKKG